MSNPVIYAAAYVLLIGAPTQVPVPSPIYDPVMCQLPSPPAPVSGHFSPVKLANNNHVTVRWRGWRHHSHCHRWGRGWRCR